MKMENPPRKKWSDLPFKTLLKQLPHAQIRLWVVFCWLLGGMLLVGLIGYTLRPQASFFAPTSKPTASPTKPNLAPKRKLIVKVVDGMNQPVAKAVVSVWAGTKANLVSAQFEPKGEFGKLRGSVPFPEEVIQGTWKKPIGIGSLSVSTNAQGIAEFVEVPPGMLVVATNQGGLHAEAELEHVLPKGQSMQEFVLTLSPTPITILPTGAQTDLHDWKIEVVDQDRPIAAALVQATVLDKRFVCITNAKGWCTLQHIPEGPIMIDVKQGAFVQMYEPNAWQQPLRIQLDTGARLQGYIREQRSGEPPQHVQLTLTTKQGEKPLALNKDGRFYANVAMGQTVVIRARGQDYVPTETSISIPDSGKISEITIDVERAGRIKGRIHDGATGAVVTVRNEQGIVVGRTNTKQDGEFALFSLPPGTLVLETANLRETIQVYSDHEQWIELYIR